MTQKTGFVKSQDHTLPEEQAPSAGDVPELATLQNRIQDQADRTKNLGLDILSYLWHGHAVPEVSSLAAEGFVPELYEGEARKLADALLSYHGHVNAGTGEADAYGFFDFMAARGFGPLTADRLTPPFTLGITCPYDLKVALARFSEMSRHHLRLLLLAGEIRGGVLGEGVTPDLANRLMCIDRLGVDGVDEITEEVCWEVSRELYAIAEDPAMNRIPTGYAELDWLLGGGLYRGGLNVVMARPGHGKTRFMANVLANQLLMGFSGGIKVFSLEMSRRMIMNRVFMASSGLGERPGTYLRGRGVLLRDDRDGLTARERRARKTWERFYANPLDISDNSIRRWDIDSIIRNLELKAARGTLPGLVLIDYFQIIGTRPSLDRQPRHEKLEDVCMQLNSFCQRNPKCAILLLAQARRGEAGSKSIYNPPSMDDMAQCDALAQCAWLVMGLARMPPDDDEDKEQEGGALDMTSMDLNMLARFEAVGSVPDSVKDREPYPVDFSLLEITKNREGATGTLKLRILSDYGRILIDRPPEEGAVSCNGRDQGHDPEDAEEAFHQAAESLRQDQRNEGRTGLLKTGHFRKLDGDGKESLSKPDGDEGGAEDEGGED